MNVSSELETPEQQGSRLCGVLGAFCGAFLSAFIGKMLMYLLLDEVSRLVMLGDTVLVGWCACWGYRLLRGYRSMKFGRWTVRISVVLGHFLAMVMTIAVVSLWYVHGTVQIHGDTLYMILARSVEYTLSRDPLLYLGTLSLGSLYLCRLSWGVLLKYVDPIWYSDPRRLAQMGGGGATFNVPAHWPLPMNEHIPERFAVDKGKLIVEGDTVTFKAWNKPPRSFSVSEVAGVILGVPSGYNILYDRENRMLAKFAWSRKNALHFGQYLQIHGVPFVDLQGAAVDIGSQKIELFRQFEVRESKLCLWVGIACLVIFGVLAVLCLFVLDELVILLALMVFLCFVLMSLWMLLAYKNHRLIVDGDTLTYTTAFGKVTRFHISDVDRIKRGRVAGSKLKDREGKTLARFDWDMVNYELLIAYLKEEGKE